MGIGVGTLGIVVDRHPPIGVVEHAPDDLHADHLGGPAPRFGLGFGLDLGTTTFFFFFFFGASSSSSPSPSSPSASSSPSAPSASSSPSPSSSSSSSSSPSSSVSSVVFVFLAALGGVEIGAHLLAIQNASCHEFALPAVKKRFPSSLLDPSLMREGLVFKLVLSYRQRHRVARVVLLLAGSRLRKGSGWPPALNRGQYSGPIICREND